MLDDFEVVFCLDDLLLHVVLLDHLLYQQNRMKIGSSHIYKSYTRHYYCITLPRWQAPSVGEGLLPALHCLRLRSQSPQLGPDPRK